VYNHIWSIVALVFSLGNWTLHLPPFLLAESSQAGMMSSYETSPRRESCRGQLPGQTHSHARAISLD
jgi:hypothetical protein